MQKENAGSSQPQNSMNTRQYAQIPTAVMSEAQSAQTAQSGSANGIESMLNALNIKNEDANYNSLNTAQSADIKGFAQPDDVGEIKSMPPITFEMASILKSDCQKIDELVKNGKLQLEQGIALKLQLLKLAFETTDKTENTAQTSDLKEQSPQKTIEEFEKNNKNFFAESEARKAVKDYLQKSFETLNADELTSVTNMIQAVENEAVKRFQTQLAHEKALDENNRLAKSRLGANSAMEKGSNAVSQKVFTRDEIGAMSIDEFKNNESEIFAQYRKGLIKQ